MESQYVHLGGIFLLFFFAGKVLAALGVRCRLARLSGGWCSGNWELILMGLGLPRGRRTRRLIFIAVHLVVHLES